MFNNTRLKLTGWYLFIIMCISTIFSVVIYANVDRELVRFEDFQQLSQDRVIENFGYIPVAGISSVVDQQLINEARGRLITDLVLLNSFILAAAGAAGYFLAGRTLAPIKLILENQARFIGDASHELKTPLTSLRAEIEIFLRDKKRTVAESDKILKSNLEEVIRLQTLTAALMELSSLEKSASKVSYEKLNLFDIYAEAYRTIAVAAQKKDITIAIRKTKLEIFGNQGSLVRLVTILLDNAIKYSPEKSKVTLSTTSFDRHVVIKVADQGIGIPDDEVDKIFDRFYRVDKSRSTKGVYGYGLGLAIAKEIASLHKGRISVKSGKKGSQFTVELPLS